MKSFPVYLPDKLLINSFYLLFFLTPLILTPFNYELFEYNKMMLTYALTVVVVGSWIIKMIVKKKLILSRTPLDIFLLLFLLSQIVSTIFSIDPHVSIWGYYSRFNGGLLSTVSYLLLYYAFVSNFPKKKLLRLLTVTLASGFLVSVYGILEKAGIDKDLWVQDVQNRVFSTMGQPNWLASYLAVLVPISLAVSLSKIKNRNLLSSILYLLPSIFYLTLLFTKSRSGFLGIWIANIAFWELLLWKIRKNILKPFLILNSVFLILTFIFGAPFAQLDRFTLPQLVRQEASQTQPSPPAPTTGSIIDTGITESARIREIVWKGAIDTFKNYPLFGSGVETFAFAYYLFRPVEHNTTSEWDFLYNKAHNEYLNYAATTGILGVGSYLLIILGFVWWSIRNSIKYQVSSIKYDKEKSSKYLMPNSYYLIAGLLSAWLSILVTNFFGFSVVVVQLFFFLIPAILFVLYKEVQVKHKSVKFSQPSLSLLSALLILFVLSLILYFLSFISRLWYADFLFARGYNFKQRESFEKSYQTILEAIEINKNEPLYYDELAIPASYLSVVAHEKKLSTLSAKLQSQAIAASDMALIISPNNVNFFKTRTRMFFILSQIDEKFLEESKNALENAKLLSPTDPKIRYNLGVIYLSLEENDRAIREFEKATELKPDYSDAYIAKGTYFAQMGEIEKAKEAYQFILKYINPDDQEAKEKLKELK